MSEPCSSCLGDAGDAPEPTTCQPFYVGGPTPSQEAFPSRFDLVRKLTRKGMLGLAAGTMIGVVALPKAAEAVTCTCGGVYDTGFRECEYIWYPAVNDYRRSGRGRVKKSSRYTTGTAGYCGSYCEYWGPWTCMTGACPINVSCDLTPCC